MRNLKQYPISAEEVRDTLQRQIESYNGYMGAVSPVIISAILEVLETPLDKDLTVMDLVLEEANP